MEEIKAKEKNSDWPTRVFLIVSHSVHWVEIVKIFYLYQDALEYLKEIKKTLKENDPSMKNYTLVEKEIN